MHNPFRKRSAADKLCVWFDIDGRPSRRYCTRTYRTRDGALGLERKTRFGSVCTAAHSALTHPVILIQTLND